MCVHISVFIYLQCLYEIYKMQSLETKKKTKLPKPHSELQII